MRTSPLVAAVSLVALLALPVGATQADPCIDADTGQLVLAESQTYLHQAETKAGNLAAAGVGSYPSWNTTAPSQSVQQGAGGGYLGTFALGYAGQSDSLLGATFVGTFSGCLDTMLVELYAFLPTNRTGTSGTLQESPLNVWTSMQIAGREIVFQTELEAKTIANSRGTATYRVRYALTGLHRAIKAAGLDPAGTHAIRLNAIPRYANTSNALFVYDTTEVPAGIRFNGTPDDTYAVVEA